MKELIILIAAAILTFQSTSVLSTSVPVSDSTPANNGWQNVGGNTYYYQNSTAAIGFTEIDGKTYYFDKNGVMQTGFVYVDEIVYDLGEDGVLDFSYLGGDNSFDGVTWDMTKDEITALYNGVSMQTGPMLVIKTDGDLKYFVFEKTTGKLLAYGSDSPPSDRTADFRKLLTTSGYKFIEKTVIHKYDAYLYEKDGLYAATAGNGSSSILVFVSPELSRIYAENGLDAVIEYAGNIGLPID